MKSKIIINDVDLTEKFKDEQDIYLTSTWFKRCYRDNKRFNPKDVRVNGLNQYFIQIGNDKDISKRIYFKDIEEFKFFKR